MPAPRPSRPGDLPAVVRTAATAAVTGVAVAGCLLLAGCGGAVTAAGSGAAGNGVQGLTGEQILARALAAATGERSVLVEGTAQGSTVKATLAATSADTTISGKGATVEVLKVGDAHYVKGDQTYWASQVDAAAAKAFAGRYVKITAAQAASYKTFLSIAAFFGDTLRPGGTVTKGDVTVVDGQRAIALVDSADGSRLYIAVDGDALPLEVDKPGTGGGTVTFTRWGDPVSVSAPAAGDVLDFSSASGG